MNYLREINAFCDWQIGEENKSMGQLTKDKLDWLRSIGAVDVSQYAYMVVNNGHLYSMEYLESKSLEEIKTEYKSIYFQRRGNNLFSNLRDKGNR